MSSRSGIRPHVEQAPKGVDHDDRGRRHNHVGRRVYHGDQRRAGRGLGEGGERLHYWVFGGPGATPKRQEASPPARTRSSSTRPSEGQAPSSAAETPMRQPRRGAATTRSACRSSWSPIARKTRSRGRFTFVNGLGEAIAQARAAAGDKDVSVMGGADVVRQALRDGHVEELGISIAPVVLGGGKRLFEGFDQSLSLEQERVRQSPARHPHHLSSETVTGCPHQPVSAGSRAARRARGRR